MAHIRQLITDRRWLVVGLIASGPMILLLPPPEWWRPGVSEYPAIGHPSPPGAVAEILFVSAGILAYAMTPALGRDPGLRRWWLLLVAAVVVAAPLAALMWIESGYTAILGPHPFVPLAIAWLISGFVLFFGCLCVLVLYAFWGIARVGRLLEHVPIVRRPLLAWEAQWAAIKADMAARSAGTREQRERQGRRPSRRWRRLP